MVTEMREPRIDAELQPGRPPPRVPPPATGSLLPTLATLGNLICGFAAIYFSARGAGGPALIADVSYFTAAGWLIFFGMVFDALDGRLARITRSTSDLGAQLDSLADVITFGMAPAFLMLMLLAHHLGAGMFEDNWLVGTDRGGRIAVRAIWVIGAIFVCCAALRLARFNVETTEDESAHMWFKGLPSPGAAAALAALSILMEQLAGHLAGWGVQFVFWFLPVIALAAAVMMVVNVPYPHAMNHFGRGRHPFRTLVLALFVLGALILFREKALAFASVGYALSGPLLLAYRRMIKKDSRTADELAAALVPEDEE